MKTPARPLSEDPPPPGISRRVRTWARAADYGLEGLAIGLMVVAAVGFSAYAGRRALVADLAEDYLRRRGVEAEIEVERVDSSGFIGRVRLGPADDPDFTAERVEVALAAPPPPEGPYALRPTAIRIVRPQLNARWTGRRLSFGSLDPLIEEALSRPRTDDPSPLIVVDQGALRLATPYGLVRAGGSAVVDDARLVRLDLALRPTRLRGERFTAALDGGRVRATVTNDRLRLASRVAFEELRGGGGRLGRGAFTLDGEAAYPDVEQQRWTGPLRLTGALRAEGGGGAGVAAGPVDGALRVDGDLSGPLGRTSFRGAAGAEITTPSLRGAGWQAAGVRFELDSLSPQDLLVQADAGRVEVTGAARVGLQAARLSAGDAVLRDVRAGLASRTARLTGAAGVWRAAGPGRLTATVADARLGDVRAERIALEGAAPLSLLHEDRAPVSGRLGAATVRLAGGDVRDVRMAFEGSAGPGGADLVSSLQATAAMDRAAAARLAAQVPVLGAEPHYAQAIARAASNARLSTAGVRLSLAQGRASALLTRPLRVDAASGARGELRPSRPLPLLGGAGGGFRVTLAGGGLPEIEADVARYALGEGGFSADLRARAALDLALAQDAVIEARGRALSRGGVFEFRAADCARITAATVELGENDLKALSAQLCPARDGALVRASDAGFRIRGRFRESAVEVPFLETRVTGGAGSVDAAGGDAGLTVVAARIDGAEADDAAAIRRYHPVALTGDAALRQGEWTALLSVLERSGGVALGTVRLRHDQAREEGGVVIAAPDITFAPEGLQPHDLTPLVAGVIGKVQGAVDFGGEIAWNPAGSTSRGRVVAEGLDFDSPAGRVIGLAGDVALSGLTPLTALAGQRVTARRVDAFTPVEQLEVRFGLSPEALQVESAAFRMAGGTVVVEPLSVPFEGERTLKSAVRVDNLNLGDLVEATPFAERVEFQAVVDGRVPFEVGPQGLRFEDGMLRSVRPGRLSIDRTLLSGVQGSGGEPEAGAGEPVDPPEAIPPNAFQDLAYQALENLAYDDMEVMVETRPEGRLGMIFKIRGRHDPARAEEARIGLFDLLRGRAFERRIPLPKDTPVNLTLDSSINLDDLLAAYMELNREPGARSDPVQR